MVTECTGRAMLPTEPECGRPGCHLSPRCACLSHMGASLLMQRPPACSIIPSRLEHCGTTAVNNRRGHTWPTKFLSSLSTGWHADERQHSRSDSR
ncbi:hypothetical protein CEXT_774801 [Caerostris extrusa]|uniref:Uncharacterized protein n=1 Tax=Caerostris extrusa TaxID=172846 RepID=A0AAV4VNF2_CAEEX|nr:hypothetical protein CEXT_774801 [Caerostris extrusa]